MKQKLLVFILLLGLLPNQGLADDFVPEGEDVVETSSPTFTLDSENAGGNLALQFGASLAELLQWDDINARFFLSNSLELAGDLLHSGNILTLDADNIGAGANVSIVAEQGTDNNGELRYNATDNVWELSNDGATFLALNPGDGNNDIFYAYDAAGATALGTAAVDITFDTEVREDSEYTHAADSAEVTINTSGSYNIDYDCTSDVTTDDRSLVTHYMMRNTGVGFVEVDGTRATTYHRTNGDGRNTASINHYQNLDLGDVIKFQAFGDSNGNLVTVADGCRLRIERLDTGNGLVGPQGPAGATGPAGADGTNGVSGGGWGEDGVTTTTALDAQIDGDLQVDGNINSDCGPHAVFWAERGGVGSNASWALGNGQTPFGSPMGCAGTVQRFAATCTGSIGTSLGAELRVNNVSSSCNLNIPATVGGVANTTCNVAFGANDIVGVYAQTEVGAWTECVGTFWVKYD